MVRSDQVLPLERIPWKRGAKGCSNPCLSLEGCCCSSQLCCYRADVCLFSLPPSPFTTSCPLPRERCWLGDFTRARFCSLSPSFSWRTARSDLSPQGPPSQSARDASPS